MSYLVLGLILLTITLSAFAQLVLKLGVAKPSMANALESGVVDAMLTAMMSPLILIGLTMYGVAAAMWLWVLSKVDLSVAYPFVGVSFLITMGFGAFILNENVTFIRIVGTILIAGGCVLVGHSA